MEFLLRQEENVVKIGDWVSVIISCAREGHADIVELLVSTLQSSRESEWEEIDSPDRFILFCAAGHADSALHVLSQAATTQHWSERISLGFALAVCCGHSSLALAVLENCSSLATEKGSQPAVNISAEDNLAARTASVLCLESVLDAILSHSSYKPAERMSSELPLVHAKLVDLDRLDSHLTEWNSEQRAFPRCQDLPSDIFWDPAGCSVWFISHRWNSECHPDVEGGTKKVNAQITPVVKFLQSHRQKYCSCYRLRNLCPRHTRTAPSDDPIGIFYDFLSLPQEPRTIEEVKIFKSGLSELDSIASDANFLALSPVHSFHEFLHHGWCFVEVCLALDFGGDFKFSCFIAEDQPELLDSKFALEASRSRRSAKQARMVHSNHIEAFFKKNEFKCTNEDDFSTLACLLSLLRAHLQKLEQLNSKRNQRRLLLQQLDMLEQSIERHQNCMSELSSQQRLQLGHVKCAALSRCFLRHLPDNHNRAFLEAASSFTSDGSTELVQV